MLKALKSLSLIFVMLSLVSSCEMFDNSPGSFSIAFKWPKDGKPDFSEKKYYAWVLLEEWVDGDKDKATLLMQTSAVEFDDEGKAEIDLSDVKYGDNRVVKVEIRGTNKTQDRVLYFGRSELFSFSSKDKDKVVNVELQTQATPGTGGSGTDGFSLQIMQGGKVVTGIKDTTVDVRIKVVNGSRVIIANSLSILEKYINDKNSVSEGLADKAVTELKENIEGYYDLEGWDLNSGLDFAADAGGERIVYGKLVNDDGYMSETVQTSVNVDKTAPSIINPVVDPNPAKLGDTVVASFSFTEPVDMTALELDWDGLAFEKAESESANVFTYTFKVTDAVEEKTYGLKGNAVDEIGNGPVEFVLGDLKIDKTLPSISDETVSVTDNKSAVKAGDLITVTFKVSEELEIDPEVTIDGKKFTRNGTSADPYSFTYTVSDSDIEGAKKILVALSDLARNKNVVEIGQSVTLDLSGPEVINPTVTPAGDPGMAGLGKRIEVRFNISEPVKELKFMVNGTDNAVSKLFTETVSDLTYTYARIVQSGESASEYVFAVSAVDNALNSLENFGIGTVSVDIVKPDVKSFVLQKTNVKLMEDFYLSLVFSEELSSVTVLVGSKDISSNCIKDNLDKKRYMCGHQANREGDEGDGVKQFSVQMVDWSGNSNTVQLKKDGGSPATIEYDVTPPEIVNPVIAPEKANLDSTVDVRFSFTENVQNLVIDWGDLAGKFTRFNEETNQKLFIYKRKITADDPEGVFPVVVTSAEDLAGNPIGGNITIGSVEIDNSAPEIFNSSVKVNGDPLRTYVVENDIIEVVFEVHESISDYSVRSGLKKIETCVSEVITEGTRYTCTYSTPTADDGEGLKDVTVEVKDLAGNSATYPAGQLTYDMSFPQLTSAIVIPEKVNSSSADVKVQFSFSEDVMINVDEVFITAANFGPELALNCNTGPDYKKSFTCSHSFESLDSRVEDYNVTVTAKDRAGNQVTDLFTGSVSVDREKPYLTSSGIEPASVRQNEPFTITFGVNEQLDAAPVVKVGDKEIPGTECSEVSAKNYSCTHTANGDGDETDGVKSVTVNLRDPAGNISIITLPGNVTYDATRPELLNPVIIPEGTANKYNSVIQVRFSFSEKIDHPGSFNFTAVSSKGGVVPPFTCTPVNSNNQSFTCQATFADEDDTVDTFSFKVAASDLAGNELNPGNAPEDIGTLNIDRESPEIVFESVSPSVVNSVSSNITVIFSVSETLKEAPSVTIGNELSSNTPSAVSGLRYTYVFNDLSALSDGDRTVTVSAVDLAGNSGEKDHLQVITVDRTDPSVIATAVAPSIANSSTQSVAVNFTFSEKVDGFSKNDVTVSPAGILTDYSCSNASGDEQSFACVFNTTALGSYDGSFAFFVTAVDKKGNGLTVDPSQIGVLTVDTNAPSLTFDSVSPLTVNESQSQVSVQFTVDTVPQGSPVVKLGSEKTLTAPQSVTNGGKTFTYIFNDLSGISDGQKSVSVDLKDDAGNTVTAVYAGNVLFDRTDPVLVSTNIAPSVVNKDTNQLVVSFTFSEKMTALTNANVTVSPSGKLPAHNCTTSDSQSYSCTVDTSGMGTDKDGTYTYSVSASDINGNAMDSPAVIGSVNVDRTDLAVTLNSFTPATANSSTPSVTVIFTLSDTPDGNPVVKLGTTKQKTVPSSVSGKQYTYIFDDLSGISDGEKTITVSAKDIAGNAVSKDFTGPVFDRTAPTVVSKSVAPSVVNKDTNQIVVSFTFSEKMAALTNANVTVTPAGLPAHTCTTSDSQSYSCVVNTSTLGTDKDNTYTYSVSGSDQNGNSISSTVIGSVLVDRTDLTVTLNSFTPAIANSSTPSVTVIFTLSDTPEGNPVVKLGTTKQKTVPSSVSGKQYTYIFDDLSGINDGEKTITVSAKDISGNAISKDFTGPVFDRTLPTVVSKSVAPAVINKDTNQLAVSFTFSEKMTALTNANVTVLPAGKLPAHNCTTSDSQSYSCTVDTSGMGTDKDGTYTYSVSGSDINGNAMGSPSVIGSVNVDRTDAGITFVSVTPAAVKLSTASVTVVFDASEPLSTNPVVSIGSELSKNTPNSVSGLRYTYTFNDLSSLSDGSKTVKVFATDSKGNSKETPYGTPVVVDRTPPVLLAGTVAPAIANSETVSVAVSFAFSEKIDAFVKGDVTVVPSGILTNFVCTNASGDEQTYSCLFDTTSLGEYEGSFTFYAAAEDKAGNPMAMNPSVIGVLTVDRNAPELTFNSVTPLTVNKAAASISVQFTVDDVPDGNPAVRIGTELSSSSPSSVTNGGKTFTYNFNDLSALTDGSKNVFVDLKDGSGNIVSATWSGTIKVDRTAPEVISSSIAPAYVNKSVNELNISFSFSEPMAVFSNGYLTVSPASVLPSHTCTALDGSNQTISCVINTSGLDSSFNGIYTFKVTGIDASGNSMVSQYTLGMAEVDRSAPNAGLNSITPANVNKNTSQITVVFTVTEPLAAAPAVKIGSEKTLTLPSSVSGLQYTYIFSDLTGITDGPKTLTVQMRDMADNTFAKDFSGLFFDRTVPQVVSSSVAPTAVNNDTNQIQISLTFSEKMTPLVNGNVTVIPAGKLPAHNCSSPGGDDQSYLCIVNVSSINSSADGGYAYYVIGSDQYGNAIASPVLLGSTFVDRTDPDITFNSFTPAVVNTLSTSVTVVFTLSETPGANPVVKLGTAKVKDAPSSVSGLQYTYIFNDLSGIADGEKTINISVEDLRGNTVSEDFAGPLFDRTRPTVILSNVSPSKLNETHGTLTVSFTFSEKMVTVQNADLTVSPSGYLPAHNCGFPSSDNQTFVCTIDTSSLNSTHDRTYSFYITGIDENGNSISAPALVGSTKVDRTDPTAVINSVLVYDQATNLVKSPQIARAGDYIIAQFTLSELLYQNPIVMLGGRVMTKLGGDCLSGTCNYRLNVLSTDGDGSKSLAIELKDDAGNTNVVPYPNAAVVDVTAPQMHSNSLSPQYAKEGTLMESRFSFSEPVHTASMSISSTIPFTKDTGVSTDSVFLYKTTVLSSTPEGAVTFSVKAKDAAGNWINSGNWQLVGSSTVDRTAPQFVNNTCIIEVSSGYTLPGGVQAGAEGDSIYAKCKITMEAPLAYDPVLMIGGYEATLKETCESEYNYCYNYDITGDEGDGMKMVTVEVEDYAGNFKTGYPDNGTPGTTQQVAFDFTGPVLVNHSFDRYPAFSSARDTGNKVLNLSVKDPYSNEFVTVSLSVFADEDINSSPAVAITPVTSGVFDLGAPSVSGNTVNYSKVLSDAVAEGLYDFKVTWYDMLGNSSTQNLSWKLYVDETEPSSSDIDPGQMVFKRFPQGTGANKVPYASLTGGVLAVPSEDIVKIQAYSSNGQYMGDATVSPDGSFSIANLLVSNAYEVYINPVKYSGKRIDIPDYSQIASYLPRVPNVEWTANLNNKIAGQEWPNPHSFYNRPYFSNYLKRSNSYEDVETETFPAESTVGGEWYTISEPVITNNCGLGGFTSGRNHGAAAYDPTEGLVYIFGGEWSYYDDGSRCELNDTHVWDGYFWERKGYGGALPPTRIGHSMVYDINRSRLILFGGDNFQTPFSFKKDDTWEWDGSAWYLRSFTTVPSARTQYCMAYDRKRGQTVLFGGATGTVYTPDSETWEYDGNGWTEVYSSGSTPTARYGCKMVYSESRGTVLMYGGMDAASTILTDLWEWDGSEWINLNSPGPSVKDFGLAWNSVDESLYLLGGVDGSSNFTDDLWIWNGSSWSSGTAFPLSVSGPLLVYNAGRNMMMVAGGVSVNGFGERTIVADTYGFVNNSWVIIDRNSHPEELSSAASAYNSFDRKIVMFGGNDGAGDTNATWEFDGISWQKKTTVTTPAVQSGHTMAFAAGSVNRTVLYTKDAKTYSYDGTNWTLKGSSALPGNRQGARMVYDSYNNKIVLFGGGYYGSGSYYFAEGTYQYDHSLNTWTKVCGSGTACSTQPPDRNDFAMVFDAKRNVTVLYGGNGFLGDTWEWNGTSWTEKTIADPEGDGNPTNQMVSPEMAYHSESGSVLLFGGDLETDTFVVWKYDGTSYKLISSTRETLRKYHSSAYFADAGRMVFHGGLDVADNLAEGTLIYNVGKSLRPMQMFSVKTDSANIPEDARIEDVNVRFTGGAQGFSNNSAVSSISYSIFYGGAWISLGDIDYDVNNTVEYSFSVKDRRLIEGMRYGTRDQVNLAFRPTVPAEGVWNDSRSVIQDVEMTVRYNLDGTVFTYPRYTSYYISASQATWQNARNDCISRGGDLLILNSPQEQAYVESLPGYVDTAYYWIGYHDIGYDLEWRSVSGTYVWQGTSTGSAQNDAYTNWYTGRPTSTYDCVFMNKSVYGGKWYNSTCATARPYICELSRENNYMISTDLQSSWNTARANCISMGGDLITIDGYNEQKEIESITSSHKTYKLGLTDKDVEGEWRWVSGSNRWNGSSSGSSYFYSNWYSGYPRNNTTYNYANLYSGYAYKWVDLLESSSSYYICEFDSPQFCSLNDDVCINGDTCCSEVCDTDAGECVNCIAENYHGCDEKADCCDGNPCNTVTDTCVNLLNTGESTCEEVGDCANVLDTCPGGKCCRANQVACSTTNDCCSTSDICYATTGKCCRFIGDYCTTVANCCFGECVLSGFRKTCECRTYNTACTLGSQCCSGSCVSLKCAKAAAGKYCYSGTDCSSGTCFKNRCQ